MSSSVKWLSNQTYELFEQYSEGNFDRITLNRLVLEATEKAKEMEKHRMIEFTNEWFEEYQCGLDNFKNPEQYYNETYGGGE